MNGILLLEDGACWEGEVFGAAREVYGEAVFNTAFCGYEELLTDPSYAGQIVVMASPHVGNYGISLNDMESAKCHLKGFVVKDASTFFSGWQAKESLQVFLETQNVFGLSGVDTRGIVKHLRKNGAMRALLTSVGGDPQTLLEQVKQSPSMIGANFLNEVTTSEIVHYKNDGPLVVLYNFGLKQNILRNLLKLGFETFVLPGSTPPEKALSFKPKGIVFSNGPGDPAALSDIVENMTTLMKAEIPILGICLGHQLLARSLGASTYKMKFGHRGVNHPVKNLEIGKVSITSHNHGFAVDSQTLPDSVTVTYLNLYDQTLEGLRHKDFPIYSVQFHPEAAPGPNDASSVFAEFGRVVAPSTN